jgi:hypothetical protein
MVVSKRNMFPDGREFVGIGISPDVEVHPTQKDLLKGTDPVLQKGIDVIRNWALYHKGANVASLASVISFRSRTVFRPSGRLDIELGPELTFLGDKVPGF